MAFALHAFHVFTLTGQEIALLYQRIALKPAGTGIVSSANWGMQLQPMNLALNLTQDVPESWLKVGNVCVVSWGGFWMSKEAVFSYHRVVRWERLTDDARFAFRVISSFEEAYVRRYQSAVRKSTWAECAPNARTGLKLIQ
jgi:hypothetical protein